MEGILIMATLTISNEYKSNGIVESGRFESGLMTAAGADTFLDNTFVARDTSTLKFVPYVKGGSTNGNGVIYGVLLNGFVAAGAGDTAVRIMVTGVVAKSKMVIDADGDSSNIDGAVKLTAKDNGIVIVDDTDLFVADNA